MTDRMTISEIEKRLNAKYAERTKSTVKYTGKDQKYWFIPSGVRIG